MDNLTLELKLSEIQKRVDQQIEDVWQDMASTRQKVVSHTKQIELLQTDVFQLENTLLPIEESLNKIGIFAGVLLSTGTFDFADILKLAQSYDKRIKQNERVINKLYMQHNLLLFVLIVIAVGLFLK